MRNEVIADNNEKFTLLEDGANAFPRIIDAIRLVSENIIQWLANKPPQKNI